MEQLTLVGQGKIEWQDVPAPRLEGPGEALVRPLAVSRCAIDLPYVSGLLPPPRPFALGHECVGEVTAVGDSVTSVRVGDRVIVPFQISCGACGRCRRGYTGSCESVPFLSAFGLPLQSKEWGGALSDLIRVPYADAMLLPAPASVAPGRSPPAETTRPTAGAASRRTAAPRRGTVLVVIGVAPSIGLYAADAALALGAGRVDVLSPIPEVLAVAERIGARPIESSFGGKHGPYDLTVDTSVDPGGLALAIRSTTTKASASARSTISASRPPCPSAACTPGHPLPFRALSRAPRDPDGRRRDRRRPSPRRDHRPGRSAGRRRSGDGGAGGEAVVER
jgi:alcohol dehydrogenase